MVVVNFAENRQLLGDFVPRLPNIWYLPLDPTLDFHLPDLLTNPPPLPKYWMRPYVSLIMRITRDLI